MVLYDLQGRISLDYLFMEDGTPIIQGAMMTEDGWPIFELTDHTVPVYALTSTLPGKALVNTILSYTVTLECTNNADPGRELHVSIDMPSGFEVIESMSDEGEYNQDTGKFSCYLNNDGIATLNLLVDVFGTGSETQTASLDGTDVTLISNCDVYTTDSDGGIAFREVDLAPYADTLANMQDGKLYTAVSYTRVSETGVTGIHDGIRNNCLSVVNGDKIENIAFVNFATGTDAYKDSTGYSQSDAGVNYQSSTEWSDQDGRSLKVLCDGSVANQGAYAQSGRFSQVQSGNSYIASKKVKGNTGSVKGHLAWYNSSKTFIRSDISSVIVLDGTVKTVSVTATAPAGAVYCAFVVLSATATNMSFYEDTTIILEGSSIPEYDYMDINGDLILNGKEYIGSRPTIQNSIQKQTCTFIYDSSKELYIRQHDQYKAIATSTVDRWYGLCINEGYNTEYTPSRDLLTNPGALFDDTGSAELTLEGNSESAEYIYKVSEETTLATQFFTGLILSLNSFGQSSSQIQAQIATDDYDSEVKTGFMATGQTGEVAFGDMVDIWGLTDTQIQNKELSLHLIFKNTTLIEQVFSYNNITLLEYYADDETGGHHSIIYNDTHGKVLGISINDDTHPEGPSFDLETKKIALSDGELPVRFNIKSKELEFDFWVHGDTLEESETKLKAIRRWLANERTSMSRPILNRLTFTYDLNREYLVIFKDAITVKKNITSLLCTAKFVVPDGVAWSTIPVVTGAIGTNPGEAQVYPLLEVICDGSDTLTITDSVTGNSITLNNAPTTNTVLYFDCATQRVTDSTGTEYTTSLAKNTVWVNFQGKANYALTVSGGVLQQVKFYPGY